MYCRSRTTIGVSVLLVVAWPIPAVLDRMMAATIGALNFTVTSGLAGTVAA
jgi:hypothetical protein